MQSGAHIKFSVLAILDSRALRPNLPTASSGRGQEKMLSEGGISLYCSARDGDRQQSALSGHS